MPIHSVVSRSCKEAQFDCANKQAGANFENLKLLIVPETKSALDIVDATLPLENAG